MSTVYFPIDPRWAHDLINGIKDDIAHLNYFHFMDNIFRALADFLKLSHNVRFVNDPTMYNKNVHAIWVDLETSMDLPVPYFQVMFRQLLNTHRAAFNVIPGTIDTVTTITTDQGDLQGFVFTLNQ